MDIASLIGMLGAFGIVLAAIFLGGSAGMFMNIPSMLIVIGGSLFVVLIKFTLVQFLGAISVVGVGSAIPRNQGIGPDGLAANRRVEIIVDQGIGPGNIQGGNIDATQPEDLRIRQDQDTRLRSRFGLMSDEIF